MNYQNFLKPFQLKKQELPKKKKIEPRVEIKETDLSDFFGTIKTGQQNQVILHKEKLISN